MAIYEVGNCVEYMCVYTNICVCVMYTMPVSEDAVSTLYY